MYKNKTKVYVIPKEIALCHRLIIETLKTHIKLSPCDRKFTADFVCNMDISVQELAKFVHHSYKLSNTGRFSLSFNYLLDLFIKQRNRQKIKDMVLLPSEQAFIELFDNDSLTHTERNTIKSMYNREYIAILNTIQHALSDDDHIANILPCYKHAKCQYSTEPDIINESPIYTKYYRRICLAFNENSEDVISQTVTWGNEHIPQIIHLSDINPDGQHITAYCFNILELIQELTKTNPINKYTQLPFGQNTLTNLRLKFAKEIKMYKRHQNFLLQHNL